MKKLCLNCAEPIPTFSSRKRKFCTLDCGKKFQRHSKSRSIEHDFQIFKNIVAYSDNYQEFLQFLQQFFPPNSDKREILENQFLNSLGMLEQLDNFLFRNGAPAAYRNSVDSLSDFIRNLYSDWRTLLLDNST